MSARSGPLRRSNWLKVFLKEIKECNINRTPQNSERTAQSKLDMIMAHVMADQLNVNKSRWPQEGLEWSAPVGSQTGQICLQLAEAVQQRPTHASNLFATVQSLWKAATGKMVDMDSEINLRPLLLSSTLLILSHLQTSYRETAAFRTASCMAKRVLSQPARLMP